MVRKILLLIMISTKIVTALDGSEAKEKSYHTQTIVAKYRVDEQTVDEFRESYIAITDPKKDEILIPAIRHNGRLDAFYLSLAENGNIDVLTLLMNMDCLLTKSIRDRVFNEVLTAYDNNESAWNDAKKNKLYQNFLSLHVDWVDNALQIRYRRIILKTETAQKHNFTVAEQAAFDEETARWIHCSF